MPSPADMAELQAVLLELARYAGTSVTALLESGAALDDIKDSYPQLVAPFIAAAAELSAQWYQDLSPDTTFAVHTPADVVPEAAMRGSLSWALTQDDPAAALGLSTERRIFDASRATLKTNADSEKVRYAWYASANACSFCRMLATRNADYTRVTTVDGTPQFRVVGRYGRPRGSRKLGDKYHDGCRCLPVPVRAGDSWQAPDYYEQFQQDYDNAAADTANRSTNDVVNHMRRADYSRRHPTVNT